MDQHSYYGDAETEMSIESEKNSLNTLPSYLGEYEARSEVRAMPSIRNNASKEIDSKGLTDILSTPIKCTITLADLLRIKPQLWGTVDSCLAKIGIKPKSGRLLT